MGVPRWLDEAALKEKPGKSDQDGLDACICLLTAVCMAEGSECLMVSNQETGYILVPFGEDLYAELTPRCEKLRRSPGEWLRPLKLAAATA